MLQTIWQTYFSLWLCVMWAEASKELRSVVEKGKEIVAAMFTMLRSSLKRLYMEQTSTDQTTVHALIFLLTAD